MASHPPLPPAFLDMLHQLESQAAESPAAKAGALAEEVIAQAALLGHFDLAWLDRQAGKTTAEAVKSAVLDASERLDSAKGTWRLRLDRRRTALSALVADPPRLQRGLEDVEARADDRSGSLLRQALGDDPVEPLSSMADAELPVMLEVASWTQELGLSLPGPHEVRRETSRRARQAAFADMAGRFVGREQELERLENFVTGPAGPPRLLAISGIGGIGKSALLARFLDARLSDEGAGGPLIVHMDFDRVGLGASDRTQLDFELTRQLGLAIPAIAADLETLRREVRDYRQVSFSQDGADDGAGPHGAGEASTVTLESAIFAGSDILYELSSLCGRENLLGRTLLFVFDTMEELQAETDWALRALAEWILKVQREAGFGDIRVVACGRVAVGFPSELGFAAEEPIVLDELGRDHAIKLAVDLGLDPALAGRVVDEFGGNPLILRLVARLVEQNGAEILDEEDEDDVAGEGDAADREVVQGVLYKRVLGHIKDKRVRALAHPGLVLRRVTPALLRDVIAPVCLKEPPLAPGEEKALFRALKREVWLVDATDDPDMVVHRTDVRRIMMLMMRKDPTRREEAKAVHQHAIDHYETGAGAAAPHARQEALYHRFMIAGGAALPVLDLTSAREAQAAIGAYLAEIPEENRVTLRVALGQSISDEEARLLPAYLRSTFVERRGPELVAIEQYREALALIDRDTVEPGPIPHWQVVALDSLAEWSELAFRCRQSLRHLESAASPDQLALTDLNCTLASTLLKLGRWSDAHEASDRVVGSSPPTWDRFFRVAQFRCAGYSARAFDAMGEDARSGSFSYRFNKSDILADETLATEHLRYLQATGRTAEQPFRPTQQLFYPSVPWLERLMELGGDMVEQALGKLVEELRGIDPSRLTTGRLLGHFAADFAKALIDPFVRSGIPPEAFAHMGAIVDHAEFRSAARVALGEVLNDDERRRELFSLLAPSLPIVPSDLDIGVSAVAPSEYIAALVAYADRCQLLPELLAHAAMWGETPMLARVSGAVKAWRTRYEEATSLAV